ncbi:hypothetical protein NLI96_g13025 [Meripilus lineatus]|uniref:Uncharacterized protein n=1 Tax=Meripilus lineatus TaxID=2056292 RepID=A0AAD5UP28_9APHY|nr:hypothetical protein NLI96_g13025 [Physisporinus lineatus]
MNEKGTTRKGKCMRPSYPTTSTADDQSRPRDPNNTLTGHPDGANSYDNETLTSSPAPKTSSLDLPEPTPTRSSKTRTHSKAKGCRIGMYGSEMLMVTQGYTRQFPASELVSFEPSKLVRRRSQKEN